MSDIVEQSVSKALAASLGASVTQFSELIADKVRYLRWTSAVRTLERAKTFAEPYGGLAKAPPLKFFLPFMENCSLEENDDEVVDLWARLLVDASRNFGSGHLLFMRILKEITGSEARLLRAICHSTGRQRVAQDSLEEAETSWTLFSAQGSPLKEFDIAASWTATKAFIFEKFQLPGVAIDMVGYGVIQDGQYNEQETTLKSDTVFDGHGQISVDILVSLNLIKRVDQSFTAANGVSRAEGVAYVTTAMGGAFYTACSPNDVVIRYGDAP